MLAGKGALGRRRARRLAHKVRQSRQIVLALEHERITLLVGEHILAERGAERREPLVDLSKPLARLGIERGTGALEHQVIALQHARLLGVEAKRLAALAERVDAAEQQLVEQDAVPVAGLTRRNLALDLEQRIVGVGARKHAKDPADPIQRAAGSLHRLDGVLERGRSRIARDRGDLGVMLRESAVVGRDEMIGVYTAKRRHTEGAAPFLEQGIVGGHLLIVHLLIVHRRYLVWQYLVWQVRGRNLARRLRNHKSGQTRIGGAQSRNTTRKSTCTRTSRSEASYPPTTG